ncbi:unnamed protein product [Caenorhabditis sp. 36 PRJEB53466]|nr:unnamed protein product [Caenorhabditis sp. 36 PRJEB53466]
MTTQRSDAASRLTRSSGGTRSSAIMSGPISTPPMEPSGKPSTPNKRNYKNTLKVENTDRHAYRGIEFLLSAIGLAVGLGNIWRFPMIVYENGGSSFLIPYIVCIFVFAIPAIHMEFALGQYAAKSPPAVFRRIMPALEGIGWMSAIVGAIIGVYYMVIISWISIYLVNAVNAAKLIACDNHWNDPGTCYEGHHQKQCLGSDPPGYNLSSNAPNVTVKLLYVGGRCQDASKLKTVEAATEQFFNRFVVSPSAGFTDFNTFNWATFGGLVILWLVTSLILLRGMKNISKTSYVSVCLPYVSVITLLVRGVTLDGASEGLYYFLWRADFSALYKFQTWSAALSQLCFSLSIGQGTLMNIASYNKKSHNWYRDTFLLVASDSLMSLLSGAAVFSTLGFLAKQRGVTVPEVVKSGHALAFIVYTEAIAHMPAPWFWYTLFFLMLLVLGLSTEIVIVEIVCSCLMDRFLFLRKKRWIVVVSVSSTLFLCGVVMATDAGYYWFDMFDEYSSGVSAVIGSALTTIAVCYLYGIDNFCDDIKEMAGEPKSKCSKYMGPSSCIWWASWYAFTPACSLILMALFVYTREYPFKGDRLMYPPVFDALGWIVAVLPFFVIPIFVVTAVLRFKKKKIAVRGAFMLQKQHPSFERIYEKWPESKQLIAGLLPEQEPGEEVSEIDGVSDGKDEESIIE